LLVRTILVHGLPRSLGVAAALGCALARLRGSPARP